MLRFIRVQWLLALLALLLLSVAGIRQVVPVQGASGMITTGTARILTTADGRTLYVFSVDKPASKTSSCTDKDKCATYWPPVLAPAGTTAPATMAGIPGKFSVVMRADGTHQLAYGGWPLYTFLKDKDSGDAYGQGVGGVWWVAVVSRSK